VSSSRAVAGPGGERGWLPAPPAVKCLHGSLCRTNSVANSVCWRETLSEFSRPSAGFVIVSDCYSAPPCSAWGFAGPCDDALKLATLSSEAGAQCTSRRPRARRPHQTRFCRCANLEKQTTTLAGQHSRVGDNKNFSCATVGVVAHARFAFCRSCTFTGVGCFRARLFLVQQEAMTRAKEVLTQEKEALLREKLQLQLGAAKHTQVRPSPLTW
jgi:hypothetical protein